MNYSQEFITNVNAKIIFKAITQQLNDWWGKTDSSVLKVGDEFTTSFGTAFWKFKIIDFKENEILTWKCIEGEPEFKCYNICAPTWDMFITDSLKNFLETGKGNPHLS